ncbi:TrkH-domain-containing protein [Schizophyllum commune H4-8]|uniref:Potassium transport protein n=1 Tax=Schizophyllum commune (strain H4-8 / FGSC 9210) TaxID=578458 RepID=D8QA14_SCHCM|nr:TrkH-domain-containing protein [Schizophyllum commune H4-8]KAI5890192.1 TrkH-domain-containing protein [Schizophyllum commune H4-8]
MFPWPEGGLFRSIRKHLNFYRVHLLCFTFVPLILSGILYACNGRYPISYVDCLFVCVSAATVCGLATIDLSTLTPLQQVIVFVQMCLGSPVFVSWLILLIRRHYFGKKFQNVINAARKNGDLTDEEAQTQPVLARLRTWLSARAQNAVREGGSRATSKSSDTNNKGGIVRKLKPEMIRRMDNAPQLVNPSGWISDAVPVKKVPTTVQAPPASADSSASPQQRASSTSPDAPIRDAAARQGATSATTRPTSEPHEHSFTIPAYSDHRVRADADYPSPRKIDCAGPRMHPSLATNMTGAGQSFRPSTKHNNFGGFPMPHHIIQRIVHALFPKLHHKIARTVTIPVTTTITSLRGEGLEGARPVPYISFDAVVGRNSAFHLLTKEQLEELGGVEYRAVNALLWIVALYHICVQVLGYVLIAPYISMSKWDADFEEPNLHRPLAAPWFALFQTVSSYTNTGMSLVDQSMIPFQTAYLMIFVMAFLILAGNTAFLTQLRSFTDWFFFMVLDIGNAAIEAIPLGTRFCIGLLQAIAVRAAGFSTVALSVLAPAVKILYIIMMYVSVCECPPLLSVRATNVYEEQSLGIFEDDDLEDDEENELANMGGSRVTAWSRYLVMHARKQLAFDMWWLGLATFLICIIERAPIDDDATYLWFNEFTILFELVSAYGTVGLSLGLPTANYSFAGALRPLSKLILCAVMLRGRHRGLPVAIDRAVMLPNEFKIRDQVEDARSMRRTFTRQSQFGSQMPRTQTYQSGWQSQMPRTQTYQSGWQTQSQYQGEGHLEGIMKLPTANDETSWRRRNAHGTESDEEVVGDGGGKEESGDDTLTEKGSRRTNESDKV